MSGLPPISVALSTSSVYPQRTPDAFDIAGRLGYDGVEVMVYTDPVSQSSDVLARLVDYHQVPVLAVHAPSLLLTQLVWGREPWAKLMRAKDLAERLGARTVVLHPPFRWQRDYVRGFEEGMVKIAEETDVIFAVENMFPIRAGTAEMSGFAPHWDPNRLDVPNVTIDLSHTAASGSDAMAMANGVSDRLAHVHLADGIGDAPQGVVIDEHLVPGRGRQPCAELLRGLAATGYQGIIVAEVNTRRASREDRITDLAETLAFAREHLSAVAAG